MFNILIGNFPCSEKDKIKNLCSKNSRIRIFECENWQEILHQTFKINIDLFIIFVNSEDIYINSAISKIRNIPKYNFTQMLFFSERPELLISIPLQHFHTNIFLLPFSENQKSLLLNAIKHYYSTFFHSESQQKNTSMFSLIEKNTIHNLYLDEILCVESVGKRSTIHTCDRSISTYLTLVKLKEKLPNEYFIQSHRSFIVNINNISFVNKSHDTWEIHFYNSSSIIALVSRSHHHSFRDSLTKINLL